MDTKSWCDGKVDCRDKSDEYHGCKKGRQNSLINIGRSWKLFSESNVLMAKYYSNNQDVQKVTLSVNQEFASIPSTNVMVFQTVRTPLMKSVVVRLPTCSYGHRKTFFNNMLTTGQHFFCFVFGDSSENKYYSSTAIFMYQKILAQYDVKF